MLWFSGKNIPCDVKETEAELLGLVPLTRPITVQYELDTKLTPMVTLP
jgi:hypothetical protein